MTNDIAMKKTEIESVIRYFIDSKAHEKGYENSVDCVSYAGDPDPIFNEEGTKFKAWRSAVRRTCYNIISSVEHGTVDINDVTLDYVFERLPVLEW